MKQKTIICDANILIDYYSAGAVKAARKMAAINRELTVTILQEFYDILEGEERKRLRRRS